MGRLGARYGGRLPPVRKTVCGKISTCATIPLRSAVGVGLVKGGTPLDELGGRMNCLISKNSFLTF
jgi:hypothetical protein